MSVPDIDLKSSPERCCDVPLPLDANVYLPGFALSSTISSVTFFAGTSGLTTSMFGTRASSTIGTKSLTGSYGRLLYSDALIACVLIVPPMIV